MPSSSTKLSTKNFSENSSSSHVVIPRFPGYFLIFCLALACISLYFLFRPFLVILLLGAILATTFYPFYERILKLFKNRSRLASFVTCLLIIFLIVIPLTLFVLLLTRQAVDIYIFIQQKVQAGELDKYFSWQQGNMFYDLLQPLVSQLGGFIDLQSIDLKKNLLDIAQQISNFFLRQTGDILKGLGGVLMALIVVLLNFIILFFSLFYFFKDGKHITDRLIQISPFPFHHDLELFRKFKEISRATLYSIFLVSIVKGVLGGISFLIVGIPNPLFWGTGMALFSLIPIVGPSIIWFPAGMLLLANGQTVAGVFILLWGALLVSTIDNFFQAFFVGSTANLNPLLVFLAVFGGIGLFNLPGVIFGPLILTIFFAFLHIYQLEYKSLLNKKEGRSG